MANYGMAFDLSRCIGCYNCQIACKDEHVGNDFPPIAKSQPTFGHFWLRIDESEQAWSPSHIKVTYMPKLCNQCEDPACLKVAKNGAVYKRADGIVIIDPEKAVGQKQLVDACPYGSIYWNEELNVAQKCTFCAHLVDDGWQVPRCVQTCPTGVMYFGDLADPQSKISQFLAKNPDAEVLNPEKGTKPKVKYVDLPKPHLSGTVRFGDTNECAGKVKVTLTGADGMKAETVTDFFGDFHFKNVKKGKAQISCVIEGYKPETKSLEITDDITFLGAISLAKAQGTASM
jgi:Fe-S-cluster-containing dehydrogenase component